MFFKQAETSKFTKKQIFELELTTGLDEREVAPGDIIELAPAFINTATEPMYVFIAVNCPMVGEKWLYDYEVSATWQLVETTSTSRVYAYGKPNVASLSPGEKSARLNEFNLDDVYVKR